MASISLNQTKQWIKTSNHPFARFIFNGIKSARQFELPAPGIIFTPLYLFYTSLRSMISSLMRIIWWTPLLKGRLDHVGKNLTLYSGLPYITGALKISVGNDCRISGQTTFSGRTSSKTIPELKIGDNVDVSYMTTIAVGHKVIIGNNVRIAGRGLLAGYPGHPLDTEARAAGLPDTDDQVGDIILEDDVWLATGVSVMSGVKIGKGTIVAAKSVVTRDLPPMVLAGGSPARVIRHLDPQDDKKG